MKQFYNVRAPAGQSTATPLKFEKPVRKIYVTATTNTNIFLQFSNGAASAYFPIYAGQYAIIDFQGANNGGGVTDIYVASGQNECYVAVSVIEYGTGGNIDWYR